MASGGFDVVVSNPPWINLREIFDHDSLGFDERTELEVQQTYFTESEAYHLQGNQATNLSSLFLERAQAIANEEAVISMLLPERIFTHRDHTQLRDQILENTEIDYAIGFENHGMFSDLKRKFRFCLLQFHNSGDPSAFDTIFHQTNLDILDFPGSLLEITPETIRAYSPSRFAFPAIETERDLQSLQTIVQHPSLRDSGGWNLETLRGLNQAREAEYLIEEEEHGDYPVYGGRNIYQFVHDGTFFDLDRPSYWGVSENRNEPSAKRRIRERELQGLDRQFTDVIVDSQEVTFEDGTTLDKAAVPMPFEEYRIAYRDIATSQNERTVIASVIPPGVVCLNTLHTIHPYNWRRQNQRIDTATPEQLFGSTYGTADLFCLLGLLNSIPFDYLMRTKVDTHVSDYLIKESQVPRISPNSPWFNLIWESAAELNCYGDQFESLGHDLDITPLYDESARRTAQATIDAAAFHAYGFEDTDVVWSVIDSFPIVRAPRVMDDRYMDDLLDRFDDLGGQMQ